MDRMALLIIVGLTILVIAFSDCNVNLLDGVNLGSDEVLEELNTKLEEKPVLLTFGSETCGACQQQDIVLDYLEYKYENSVYFMYVDVDEHPRLASDFGVFAIPDTSVIVMEENGTYSYLGYDGIVSTDRGSSRWIGTAGVQSLSPVLDMAIDYRNNVTTDQ